MKKCIFFLTLACLNTALDASDYIVYDKELSPKFKKDLREAKIDQKTRAKVINFIKTECPDKAYTISSMRPSELHPPSNSIKPILFSFLDNDDPELIEVFLEQFPNIIYYTLEHENFGNLQFYNAVDYVTHFQQSLKNSAAIIAILEKAGIALSEHYRVPQKKVVYSVNPHGTH